MKKFAFSFLFFLPLSVFCQSSLTIEKIMQDPRWIGTSPSNPFWSVGSDTLFFYWNPDKNPSDSIYYVTLKDHTPKKAGDDLKRTIISPRGVNYNLDRSAIVYSLAGDIFYRSMRDGKIIQITETAAEETNPVFSLNDNAVIFRQGMNLIAWSIATGQIRQLTDFSTEYENSTQGRCPAGTDRDDNISADDETESEIWLKKEQFQYMNVLRKRDVNNKTAAEYNKRRRGKTLKRIFIGGQQLRELSISPDGNNIAYLLVSPAKKGKNTIVPDYVTNSGFTTGIPGRKKVGEPQDTTRYFIFDRTNDSVYQIKTNNWDGIRAIPEFYKEYPDEYKALKERNQPKPVNFDFLNRWSSDGKYLLFSARSQDNKDRWILVWDAAMHQLVQADHQHDEAWIDGPGIYDTYGWIDDQTIYYQSEKTGFSHLYTYDLSNKTARQLTSGNYEVQAAALSPDRRTFYLTTNAIDPGQTQFYQLNIASGKQQRITTMTGGNEVTASPDGKQLAVLYSYTNKPWELYLQQNKPGTKPVQITFKAESDEWKTYPWRDPEIVTFTARDGAKVTARLFKPSQAKAGAPAVVFVHGAGYLQNAHKWWSYYFRENMFHNLLADNGYYVIDADYRGSAGYGRDWRTGIYRYMGGKDLADNVDAAKYLIAKYGVDPHRIGIYGGSYGGFITLMAMFTTPDIFAAGAGLRSVTEWANYNHGYTSNILNEPQNDSIAYKRSSPIYFAEGLKGHLLMCHGLVDKNVQAQDIIKLTQRLIELKKENWELALFPVEDHGFEEPASWMDEYKRIFKLFETVLKAK